MVFGGAVSADFEGLCAEHPKTAKGVCRSRTCRSEALSARHVCSTLSISSLLHAENHRPEHAMGCWRCPIFFLCPPRYRCQRDVWTAFEPVSSLKCFEEERIGR